MSTTRIGKREEGIMRNHRINITILIILLKKSLRLAKGGRLKAVESVERGKIGGELN